MRRQGGGRRSRDRHDGSHRQVDAAGGDDEGHAERQDRDRGAAVQYVDQAAEETTILKPQGKEVTEDKPVDEKHQQEGRYLREPLR